MSESEDRHGGDRRGPSGGRGGPKGRGSDNRSGGHGNDRRSGDRYPNRQGGQKRSGGSEGGESRHGTARGGQDARGGGKRNDRVAGRGNEGNRSDRPQSGRGSGGQWKDRRRSDRTGERAEGPRGERSGERGDRRGYSGGSKERQDRPRRDDRSSGGKPSGGSDRRGSDRSQGRADRADHKRSNVESGKSRHRDDKRSGDRNRAAGPSAENRRQKPANASPRPQEPELPEEAQASELHGEVRRELRGLPKGLADKVAVHLVAAGQLMDSEPERALAHARFARRSASRVGAVREANGLTAYQVGEWGEALTELRAARRMAGGAGHLAIMADCERALGRSQRALELSRSPEAAELEGQQAVELRIVAAGARRDLGQIEASVVGLQTPDLDPQRQEPWSARLFYAYADNLLAADRVQEAFTWFVHAAHADDEGETDAPERLDELVVRLGGPDVAEELVAEVESRLPAGMGETGDEGVWESPVDPTEDGADPAEGNDGDTEGGSGTL